MATTLYSIEAFEQLVRELAKEVIREELQLELTNAPPLPPSAQKKPQQGPVQGPAAPMQSGDRIMVPGTNMNLNQFMDAMAKETNMKKKGEMLKQANQIMQALGLY